MLIASLTLCTCHDQQPASLAVSNSPSINAGPDFPTTTTDASSPQVTTHNLVAFSSSGKQSGTQARTTCVISALGMLVGSPICHWNFPFSRFGTTRTNIGPVNNPLHKLDQGPSGVLLSLFGDTLR